MLSVIGLDKLNEMIAAGRFQHKVYEEKSVVFREDAVLIVYPAASNFVKWLLSELDKHNISYTNYDTQSDFYSIDIGKERKLTLS